MIYEELRKCKDNTEVRSYLNKMTKQGLVDYYFKNLSTATNKELYLKKTKKALIEMILNHYNNIRRDEKMEHIIV